MTIRSLLLIALLLLPTSLNAETLIMNGKGTRKATIFGIKVYNASLYLNEASSDPEKILTSPSEKRLTLDFLRDLSNDKIREAWSEGVRKNVTNHQEFETPVREVSEYFGEVKTGDQFEFIFKEDSLTVKRVGRDELVVKAPGIDEAFLSIWLGQNPPDEGLKRGLLGQS